LTFPPLPAAGGGGLLEQLLEQLQHRYGSDAAAAPEMAAFLCSLVKGCLHLSPESRLQLVAAMQHLPEPYLALHQRMVAQVAERARQQREAEVGCGDAWLLRAAGVRAWQQRLPASQQGPAGARQPSAPAPAQTRPEFSGTYVPRPEFVLTLANRINQLPDSTARQILDLVHKACSGAQPPPPQQQQQPAYSLPFPLRLPEPQGAPGLGAAPLRCRVPPKVLEVLEEARRAASPAAASSTCWWTPATGWWRLPAASAPWPARRSTATAWTTERCCR
jgi:hypothetical protein